MDRTTYTRRAGKVMPILLEEPESHLHPKVQSRLAHWLVALARCNRQLVIETHSDHLLRRLRGMVARAGAGTELESWMLENVRIYAVTQTGGESTVVDMALTPYGEIGADWPSDFMDEGSDEDNAIYYAGLLKKPKSEPGAEAFVIQEDSE